MAIYAAEQIRPVPPKRPGFDPRLWAADTVFSGTGLCFIGTFHDVREAHLHRYLAGFDFRYNRRTALKVTDTERHDQPLAVVGGSASPISGLVKLGRLSRA